MMYMYIAQSKHTVGYNKNNLSVSSYLEVSTNVFAKVGNSLCENEEENEGMHWFMLASSCFMSLKCVN